MFLRKTLLATCCCAAALASALPTLAAETRQFPSEQGSLTDPPIVKGLDHPWAVAFLPDKQGFLVTERPGALRYVSSDGKLSAPLSGVPQVWAKGRAVCWMWCCHRISRKTAWSTCPTPKVAARAVRPARR